MADSGQGDGFKWTVLHRPSYASLSVDFSSGGSITGEAGSMISHSAGLQTETKLHGGFLGALSKIFAGESMFTTTYTSANAGSLSLAPTLPGDIVHISLDNVRGGPKRLSAGAFLAKSRGVSINTLFGGFATLFGGAGLFVLEASGTGDLFVSSFGAITEIAVDGAFTVDTGHIVAWDPTLEYTIKKVGGWKSTFLSGEGLVMNFTGRGKILVSSRNLSAFVSWLVPWLPR